MLVLGLYKNKSNCIHVFHKGEYIGEVMVSGVSGNQVKLSLNFDKTVTFERSDMKKGYKHGSEQRTPKN